MLFKTNRKAGGEAESEEVPFLNYIAENPMMVYVLLKSINRF